MKSITEFISFKLIKGIEAKKALAAEGKSPEEIEASLAESFKLEGDKLKYFLNCMDVATEHPDKLARVRVVQFTEGEQIPDKAIQKDEDHYLLILESAPKAVVTTKAEPGKSSGPKKGKGGPKPSPWGLSPEEEAAKKATAMKAKQSKK